MCIGIVRAFCFYVLLWSHSTMKLLSMNKNYQLSNVMTILFYLQH